MVPYLDVVQKSVVNYDLHNGSHIHHQHMMPQLFFPPLRHTSVQELKYPHREILVAVTQHTDSCCSTQVVDITFMKYRSANITSFKVVQQKHCGSILQTYTH